MKPEGKATLAMFKSISDYTYDRAMQWFKENPCHPPYCYWAKDEFISVGNRHNKEVLDRHPEIEDIDDHTVVSIRGDVLYFTEFCPKLRTGIADILGSTDSFSIITDRLSAMIRPCGDNFIITVTPK